MFSLSKPFRKTPIRQAAARAARQLAGPAMFEQLEDRRLQSATLSNGTLYLGGGSTVSNTVDVSTSNGITWATVNGQTTSYASALVSRIEVSGLYGNDTVRVLHGSTPVTVYDYGGNDSITTGGGNDSIFAAGGNDTVNTGAGNDYIDGGAGSDVIDAGDGADTVYGDGYNAGSLEGADTIRGGAGDDRIYGNGGNDVIWGEYSMPASWVTGNDYIDAGAGNDSVFGDNGNDTIRGGAGDDQLYDYYGDDYVYGDAGNDVLWSEFGNDVLDGGADWDCANYSNWTHSGRPVTIDLRAGTAGAAGEYDRLYSMENATGTDGNDTIYGSWGGGNYLVGGGGSDRIFAYGNWNAVEGGAGDDTIIAINDGGWDRVWGGGGTDVMWVDPGDTVNDADAFESRWTVNRVSSFANGADRSLNGDNIADPTDAGLTRNMAGSPLFASGGPTIADINQRGLGDCWLQCALGVTARNNPWSIRGHIAAFGDGTYGVALGGKFYRVDADLPSSSWTALPGVQGSTWALLMQKAYAHFRNGSNTYASLNGGNPNDVFRALNATDVAWRGGNSNGTDLLRSILADLRAGKAACILTFDNLAGGDGAPLIGDHCYSVVGVNCDASGTPVSLVLRNPWGFDGAGNDSNTGDGYVTVTAYQAGRNIEGFGSAFV